MLFRSQIYDHIDELTDIKDFLNLPTTIPGDIVSYFGPAQNDAWSAVVQKNTNGKKCLGQKVCLGDVSVDDYSYDSDNSSGKSVHYISDSDTYLSDGGRNKKNKSKSKKSKKNKSKSKKSKKNKSKSKKSKKNKTRKSKKC